MATEEKSGVDVCLEVLDSPDTPKCLHGPTLLFKRYVKGKVKEYYACSAYRERRQCSFYQSVQETDKAQRKQLQQKDSCIKSAKIPGCTQDSTHKESEARLKKFLNLPQAKRTFCQTCGQLLQANEMASHKGHVTKSGISSEDLKKPTSLLIPIKGNKANAQYHFTQGVVDLLLKTIEKKNLRRIVCIGVPKLHEAIKCRKRGDVDSFLLDIDTRLEQFWSSNDFCRYNMFNHHFFGNDVGRQKFRRFLTEGARDTAIVIDPPFGGRVEVIAHTLRQIMAEWRTCSQETGELDIIWIFPYFMEHRILEFLPSFTMLDYKVDYGNHPKFRNDRGGQKAGKVGSPVRLFTNVTPAAFVLPKAEGYRLCDKCERYVSKENKHCDKCNACTSKDGRQYVHCDRCQRCVKPVKVHCDTCGICDMVGHPCGKPKGGSPCGDLGDVLGGDLGPDSAACTPRAEKRKSSGMAEENGRKRLKAEDASVK